MLASKKKDNAFDEMLRQAIVEKFYEEVESLPPNDELAKLHTFTPEHETRMRKLFARDKRRDRIKDAARHCTKAAAMFMLAATLLFGLMMLVPQVRAAVYQTLMEWHDQYVKFKSEAPKTEKTNLEPTYIPDGFVETERVELPEIVLITYTNSDTGEIITFDSTIASASTAVDNENKTYSICKTDDIEYHIFTSTVEGGSSIIIWEIDSQRYCIISTYNVDDLVEMANSAKK